MQPGLVMHLEETQSWAATLLTAIEVLQSLSWDSSQCGVAPPQCPPYLTSIWKTVRSATDWLELMGICIYKHPQSSDVQRCIQVYELLKARGDAMLAQELLSSWRFGLVCPKERSCGC